MGPRRSEGDILCLFNSTSWVQKGEKTRSGISSTRLLGYKKARRRDPASRQRDFLGPRRRDPASRQRDFLGPRRREGEIRHLVNSTSWVQEDKKARSGISSTRLPGYKKTRRRDPASSQLDFLGPRRREDEKARSDISSTRLLGSKKTRRRDPASRQLDFLGTKKQEGEIRHLVNSTSWVQDDEKARSGISSARLLGCKKTRRRDPASRQLDFLGTRRREGEIRHLVNSTSWVQEDEKARSGISSTRLPGYKKRRRRDPASRQLDFLGPTRREGEIRHLVNSTSWVREGEIRHLVNSTSWVQEDKKARSGILSTRLLGSKKTKRRVFFSSCQVNFLGPGRREGEFLHSFLCGRIAPLLSSTWL